MPKSTTLDRFIECANRQDTHFYKTRRFNGKREAISYLKDHHTHCEDCQWWDSLMELVDDVDTEAMEKKTDGLKEFLDSHVEHIEAWSAERAESKKSQGRAKRVNRQLAQAEEKHRLELAEKEKEKAAAMAELEQRLRQEMEEMKLQLTEQHKPKTAGGKGLLKKAVKRKPVVKKKEGEGCEKPDAIALQPPVIPLSSEEAIKITCKKDKVEDLPSLESLREQYDLESTEEKRLAELLKKSRSRLQSLDRQIKSHPDYS